MPNLDELPLHQLTVAEIFKHLETSEGGLSPEEAQQRLSRYGPNVLEEPGHYSLIRGFLHQFTHFLAILLWIATALAFTAEFMKPGEGMATLGWAILGVIVINAVFAFFQEYKAERAVHALHRLLPARAWVLRGNQPHDVSRSEIVPGDVLLIEEGEQVPADARLIEASDMRVDLSSLTGKSQPKRRTAEPVIDGHLQDIPNLVFAGTPVLSGRGRAVVFATGMQTEFGKIARLSTSVETGLSPLQKEIAKVTHVVAMLSVAMGGVFFVIGVSMGLGFWISAIFGIGIIVANVPEGLLPTVTLALALGSQRMAAFRLGIFTNQLILWGLVTELTLLALIVYTPLGNAIFGTSPLPAWIFGPLALGALVLLFAEESRKFIVNRFTNNRAGGVTQQAGTS